MLYMTRIEVRLPSDMPPAAFAELRDRETARAHDLQRQQKLVHLWRVAGQAANVSIWNCADNDEFHGLLSSMPMFPFFRVEVVPLAQHPSALE